MKVLFVFAVLLSTLSLEARADQHAYKIFTQNEGKTFLGKTPAGKPCTLGFFNETMYYTFWKDASAVKTAEEAGEASMNSISPGHFFTNYLTKTIAHKGGGQFSLSCLLMGRCAKSSLELKYKNLGQFKSLVDTFDGKESGRCEF